MFVLFHAAVCQTLVGVTEESKVESYHVLMPAGSKWAKEANTSGAKNGRRQRYSASCLLKKKLAAHPLPKTASCCWPLLIQPPQTRKTKVKLAQEHCSSSGGAACPSTINTGPRVWKTQTKIFLTFIVEIAISPIFWCLCCSEKLRNRSHGQVYLFCFNSEKS